MKKILLFENNLSTIDIVDVILSEIGFELISSNKLLLIEEIIEINPKIILIDYRLDNGYGDKLCLKIKKNSQTKHIPVLLFSAMPDLETISGDSCADGYIEKPFDLYHFEKTINKFALA